MGGVGCGVWGRCVLEHTTASSNSNRGMMRWAGRGRKCTQKRREGAGVWAQKRKEIKKRG